MKIAPGGKGSTTGVEAIVLDIEGTTTPIAFVYDVLFPFARRHLREFLQNPANAEALRDPLRRLHEEWIVDSDHGPLEGDPDHGPPEGGHYVQHEQQVEWAASYVEWLMDRDRKSPGLKLLQGRIWEDGYRAGALKGEVFADVPPALERWRDAGLDVAIYSSGSELAQRLIFGSTIHGDLTRFIVRFFDTAVGAKGAPASYRRIAAELGRAADRLVFISDVTVELDAAASAGCEVILCVRPGNRPQPDCVYTEVSSFEEIEL
jgi:enolase-phosphatase E1